MQPATIQITQTQVQRPQHSHNLHKHTMPHSRTHKDTGPKTKIHKDTSILPVAYTTMTSKQKRKRTTIWKEEKVSVTQQAKHGVRSGQLQSAFHGICWRSISRSHLSDPAPARSWGCGHGGASPSARHPTRASGSAPRPPSPAHAGQPTSGSPADTEQTHLQHSPQTPTTGLSHPSFNHCHNWLCHMVLWKLLDCHFFVGGQN